MNNRLKTLAVTAILCAGLAGCNSTNINAHTAVIDHQDTGVAPGRTVDYKQERGELRRPKSDHVTLLGDQSKAFLAAGKEHFKDQNFGLAEENFRKAVEVRSDNANAWLGLAASLDQLGRFDFADRAYKQLVQLEKNNARVYNNIGYSHLLRGDYSKARQYFNRAQNIDPGLEEIQGNIHLLEKTISG
ncbi:MAG: tetratricopeptide repeat protein [Pseudomonadota bacterium]